MVTLSRSITIRARVDEVFRFLEDKAPFPEFWPNMIEVSEIRDLPNEDKHYHWTQKMAGLRFEGVGSRFESILNKKLVSKAETDTGSTITWLMEAHSGATDVTFQADYMITVPALGGLAEKVVVKLNERQADTMLADLKTLIEA